jgi:hypothetical protein
MRRPPNFLIGEREPLLAVAFQSLKHVLLFSGLAVNNLNRLLEDTMLPHNDHALEAH